MWEDLILNYFIIKGILGLLLYSKIDDASLFACFFIVIISMKIIYIVIDLSLIENLRILMCSVYLLIL